MRFLLVAAASPVAGFVLFAATAVSSPVGRSPKGNGLIAFTRTLSGGSLAVFVMNSDGTGVRRLTHSAGSDGAPAWSPDGKNIAFQSDRDGGIEIYTMKADGRGFGN